MPIFEPHIYQRRSIRLKDYNYSQSGAYFVTINTFQKGLLFGQISNDIMMLNEWGKIVRDEWLKTAEIRHEIELDEYIIMPNHLHAIVITNNDMEVYGDMQLQRLQGDRINNCKGDRPVAPTRSLNKPRGPKSASIGSLIAGFKSAVTKNINQIRRTPYKPVWQRNYYEHVIRDDEELNEIKEYIIYNPLKWAIDPENPTLHTP